LKILFETIYRGGVLGMKGKHGTQKQVGQKNQGKDDANLFPKGVAPSAVVLVVLVQEGHVGAVSLHRGALSQEEGIHHAGNGTRVCALLLP